jgi:transcriptional regulator with XRE-family HTH domain
VPRQLPLPDHWRELGDFIREQRSTARLSLRRLSELAGISNPYLSQIERGLRKPSAEILQQIAKALRISAETLYVQAGILEPSASDDVQRAVLADRNLSEEHKQTLLRIYASFLHENVVNPDTDDEDLFLPDEDDDEDLEPARGLRAVSEDLVGDGQGVSG